MGAMDSARAALDAAAPTARPPRVWPFQHVRLAAFFLATAILGVALGFLLLGSTEPGASTTRARWALAAAVLATAAIGFTGVLVHRLRVLALRWIETRSYLNAIERESEKYRLLMQGAADMLLIVDPESGDLLEWNARAREGLGLPSAEASRASDGAAADRTIDAFVAAEDRARLRAALAGGDAGREATPLGELRLRSSNGQARVADARLATIALQGERVVLLALRDVTRQKEIEKELAVRERLASIGLLTAGVAHEINNPLEGIANYLRLAERHGLSDEARAESFDQVRHGLESIRTLVRDLLSFARPTTEACTADLAEAVDRARKLTAYSEPLRAVEVVLVGLERPIEVVGDPGRLEQVVFNLLLNAAEAMDRRGRVTVRAARSDPRAGSPRVILTVEDEGPGIRPEHLDRLFDPFFTTGSGTGLGLSVSYGIARAHGGSLSAANRPEGGAVFTLALPLRGPRES